MAAINVSVGGDTRQLDRDIQKTVNKVYSINLKTKGEQPLGRITGQVNEFSKSLDASNARVIAFGASAGIIFGIERAFSALVSTTIEVQKSLQDINVILNVSSSQLNKFGADLFNIAKNTGQSFQEVAKAATEFSRQGLGVEETLKRTNQALVLSRLSGLDAAKSVEALTAAVNSYAAQAVTASEVVNKFANVDAAFAVSSADLADALARVGSSAAQSGVSLNELIAVVTSAQQTTARGGAVIGNSFKTIFTRLQRGKVIDLLENLGIDTKDSSGQIKSTINLLEDLAKTYDQLSTLQQADVAEKVGGVFQINILKAALADLGKEYSIYNNALNVAASTTDQAIRRNEELNKTYASQLNALQENAKQLAASAGQRVLGPTFERVVGGANQLLGGINESEGNSFGATLGKGVLDGLGQIIAGPGLVLLGGIFAKLFADLSKFAVGSAKDFLGLNNAAKQQAELQRSITDILSRNPALIQQMSQGTAGVNKLAETLLTTLRAQTVELKNQQTIAAQVAGILAKSGVRVQGGIPTAPTPGKPGKAAGFIPNFASDRIVEKYTAMSLGASPSVRPHMSKGTIGGKKFVMNNQEVEIPGFGRNGDSAVVPLYGDRLLAASGFIPNFAKPKQTKKPNKKQIQKRITAEASQYKFLVPSITEGGGPGVDGIIPEGTRQGFQFPSQQAYAPKLKQTGKSTKSFEERIYSQAILNATNYTSKLNPPGIRASKEKIEKNFGVVPGAKGALQAAIGSTFEVAIISALDYEAAQRKEGGDFDVRGGTGLKNVQDLFRTGSFKAADFKSSTTKGNIASFRDKVIKELSTGVGSDVSEEERRANAQEEAAQKLKNKYPLLFAARGRTRTGLKSQDVVESEKKYKKELDQETEKIFQQKYQNFATGFVPNFVSTNRGVPISQIRAHFDKSGNPIAVTNTRDEPNGLKDAINRERKGIGMYSRGFIPNFVEEDRAPADLSASVTAIVTQLGFVAFALSGFGSQYKQSLQELTAENQKNAQVQKRTAQERAQIFKQELKSGRTKEQAIAAANYGPGGGQKFGAAIGAGGAGLAIGAPIIAETIANAIGRETREARIGSATASAFGQVGTFAGTGALVAGPKGAAVGALIGALAGLTGVIKEFNTNIPELAAQATESSSKLTKFNEASQRVTTAFEQIEDLRSRGQAVEAGKAQQELLKNINKDFADNPDLQAKAVSAVINKDFQGLQQALKQNTDALLKADIIQQKNLAQQTFVENAKNIGFLDKEFFGASPTEKSFDVKDIKKFQEEFNKFFTTSTFANPQFEKYGTPEGESIRKNYEEFLKLTQGLGTLKNGKLDFSNVDDKQLESILDKAFPDLQETQKSEILNFDSAQVNQFLQNLVGKISPVIKTFSDIDANLGKSNEAVSNIIKNINDVKGRFDKFAQSASFAVTLQNQFNQALKDAKNALEVAKIGNFANAATALGDTNLARSFSIQGGVKTNEAARDKTINTEVGGIKQTLVDFLLDAVNTQAKGVVTTPGINTDGTVDPDPLKAAQKSQEEIAKLIDTIDKQLSGAQIGTGTVDPFASVEDNLNKIFAQIPDLSEEQRAQLETKLTPQLQKLTQEAALANVLLKQQNALIAEEKVGEIMQEFINATKNAFGGTARFTGQENLTFLNPLREAIRDLVNLNKGVQGRPIDIEQGRSSLTLLEEINKIVGRNIIPDLGGDNPVVAQAVGGLGLDLFDRLKEVFGLITKLPEGQGEGLQDAIIEALREQSGVTEERANELLSTGGIDALLQEISKKIAQTQVGVADTENQLLENIRKTAIERLEKTPGGEDLAKLLKSDFAQSLSIESQMVLELNQHTTLLQQIADLLKNPPDSNPTDEKPAEKRPTDQTFDLNTSVPTLSKGFVPSYAKEMNSIRKGVGGAKGTDYPLFVPNLNGDSAFINSGEKLIPNFANTGETAVLTRKMQKAMNMAEGYIPTDGGGYLREKELQEALVRAAGINSLIQKNLGLGFEKPLGLAGEIPDVDIFDGSDPKNKGYKAFTEIYGRSAKVSFKAGEGIRIGTLANEATALTQNELPAEIAYNPSMFDEQVRQMREMGRSVGILGERGAITDKETLQEAQAAYVERLKTYADKIIELNSKAQNPFTKITNLKGNDKYDLRAFGYSDNDKIITSEFNKKNSRDYSIERLSSLNAMLFEGLQKGSIKKEDLIAQGFAKDQNEADYIFKEIEKISSLIGLSQPITSSISVPGVQKPSQLPLTGGVKPLPSAANFDSTLPGGKDFASTIIDTYKTINNSNLNTDPANLIDQYIKNPGKLMLDNPEAFDLIDKSVKGYLKDPTKTPTRDLDKEVFEAFNAKDPELMKTWLSKLGLGETGQSTSLTNKDAWDRIADRNGGWDKAINNKKLPMAIRMGLWNRRVTGYGKKTGAPISNIPRTGQVITVGYVNGPNSPTAKVSDFIETGFFAKDGVFVNPTGSNTYEGSIGQNMVREMNYVKPDGTVLTYKRVRGEPGKPMPLRLVSATRPPNQEYVTEGTSNDVIGVKEGNTTKYYSTADAPLGGLGEYKGQKVIDKDGNAKIFDNNNKQVGSSKNWSKEPEVQKAIEQGGSTSDIEKAVTAVRDRKQKENPKTPEVQKPISPVEKRIQASKDLINKTDRLLGNKPTYSDTRPDSIQKAEAQKAFEDFRRERAQKEYTPDGIAVDTLPKEKPKTVPPPKPPKQVTPEKVDKEIPTKAKGYIPSFAKEMSDIRKGVGGAIPTDQPLFVPNLNGSPAIINSGEKLVPNFANTGETAVLTREMQKMMSMAKGYIPNLYDMSRTYSSRDRLFEINSGVDLMRRRRQRRITRAPGMIDRFPGAITRAPGMIDRFPGAITRNPGMIDRFPGARRITTYGPASDNFILNAQQKQLGSSRSLSYNPAVQKAIQTRSISEIERATKQARNADYANRGQQYGTVVDSYTKPSPKIAALDARIQASKELLNRGDTLLGDKPRFADTKPDQIQKIEAQQSFNNFLAEQSKKEYIGGVAADLLDEKDKPKTFSKGYIPNFAMVDPQAKLEAKLREKEQAGPDSIPTFTMYQGKPMVYDANTQTPASAIRDHAFEGGYEGVVKRQFGAAANKNVVANMAYNMKAGSQQSSISNSPVFNINFNPQTSFSSQKGGDVPNFANITKKYDSMMQEMRENMGIIWNKYNSLENVSNANVRNGNLQTPPPRTQRQIKSII